MTVRQQLIAKLKKKQCIYCGKWRLLAEIEEIDKNIWQCPEHDLQPINNSGKRSATSKEYKGSE